LWRQLRAHRLAGHSFKRQQPIGQFIVDFICFRGRLIVEVDGDHHKRQLDADRERTEVLEALGYTMLRFSNHEVLKQTAAVLQRVCRQVGMAYHPSPLGRGRGRGLTPKNIPQR